VEHDGPHPAATLGMRCVAAEMLPTFVSPSCTV
jgi:hypothetical protein